jgi:methanogenic corrinoid protein MtbC1
MNATSPGYLRIGELARRSGVSPELLRAWERRYGLLRPSRSAGGFRLYGDEDVVRIRRMNELLGSGLSAAEAATRALEEPPQTLEQTGAPAAAAAAMREAMLAFDDTTAHEVLDSALASLSVETVLWDVVVPTLRTIGDGWEAGTVTVAQEHFASNVLRGRLLGLARGWGRGVGPVALLACPQGEQHDLPLLLYALALRANGWRIAFLGADTPLQTVERVVEELRPDAVVLSLTTAEHGRAVERDVKALAARTPVFVGGRAADEELARRTDATLLEADFGEAAEQLAAELRR